MADQKTTDLETKPQVRVEAPAEELVDKVVIDPIEKAYGTDPSKISKTIKVKAEKKTEAAEPKESVKDFRKEESKEKTDEPVATTKTEPVAEKAADKKIEVGIKEEWNDPLDIKSKDPVKDAKLKQEEKALLKTSEQLQDEIIAPEIKKAAEAWKKFTASPIGKFVAEIVDSGADPIEALQDIQYRDYSIMDSNKLMESYFSKIEGLKGEELQAAIDEHFNEDQTTGNQRRRAEREARTSLDYKQQEVINKVKTKADNNKNKGQEIIPQFHSEVEKEIEESYEKKAAYGIKLTTDQAKSLKEESKEIFKRLINPDGTVDARRAAAYVFFEDHGKTALKNAYLKGLTEGQEKILDAVNQPDRMESSISVSSKAEKETTEQVIDRNYGNVKSN